MELSKEERSAKRRELAIQHQAMRQKRKAEELAKLPPDVLNRSLKRYIRHGREGDSHALSGYGGTIRMRDSVPLEGEVYFFVFTGEWGYEILWSHGWLRRLKKKYPETFIGIASRAGVEFLYEDACNAYVDITDILASYTSTMYGLELKTEDAVRVETRCRKVVGRKSVNFIYSSKEWINFGIMYGPGRPGTSLVRDPALLALQEWKELKLHGMDQEREEIEKIFPGLLSSEYIIVQDRRREGGWGPESYSAETWKAILKELSARYKLVLIGYKPWKQRDAVSIFYEEKEFENIPNTVNASKFLSERLKRNLAYQAVLFKHAQFWIGVWGSASMLAPILGVKSYVLSAGRGSVGKQQRDFYAWRGSFAKCGGAIEYINTDLTTESVIASLKAAKISAKIAKIKDADRVAVINICWNRFLYTKHCLNSLFSNAGMQFDHYIIDNGSTDETEEWLAANKHFFKRIIRNETNLGIGNAMVQIVKLMEKEGHKWCIIGPNDADILSQDFVKMMLQFWKLSGGKYLFAPSFTGIGHKPRVRKNFEISHIKVQSIGTSGCVYVAHSVSLLKEFLEFAGLWRARDFCNFAAAKGMENLYLTDVSAKHFETTANQMIRYPDMKKGYRVDIDLNTKLPGNPGYEVEAGLPLVSFITRCYKRPKALSRCQRSIETQTDIDHEQVLIIDDIGKGLLWANQQFHAHRERVKGKYVQFIDDDDYFIDTDFVKRIREINKESDPDIIITKIDAKPVVYPTDKSWNKEPIRGEIMGGCVCVKNEVFQKHIHAFGQPKAGDYFFIKEIFDNKNGYKIHWEDRITIQAVRGYGRTE